MLPRTEYRHYWNAVVFSCILAMLIALFILMKGKEGSFLLINHSYNAPLDELFRFWTYLGDGLIWIPLFAYTLLFRKKYLVAVISALVICTILTQVLKKMVFPSDFRPIVLLGEKVRTIPGYFMNRAHSFPSGHTSTAFTLALLMSFISRGRFWIFFFPLVAFFVGYSRVYLAQHFATDVLAGLCVGIISSLLALLIYERIRKNMRGNNVNHQNPHDG